MLDGSEQAAGTPSVGEIHEPPQQSDSPSLSSAASKRGPDEWVCATTAFHGLKRQTFVRVVFLRQVQEIKL